jgi:peroxiredoxin Q/BCP
MALIEPGQKAPAFALKDQHGEAHRLSDYAGQHVVLYFYPKDDTPGCTKESCDFQASLPTYKRRKAAVLGVSILDEKSKAKFATKHGLTFPLLADADHAVAEKYGVWQEKSRYGRKYMGIARTTYLIGPDGKVVQRWDNVKVDGHVDAVAEALRTGVPSRAPVPLRLVERKSDLHRHLPVGDFSVLDVAARLRDLEPPQVPHRRRGARDGVAHGFVAADRR